jgi:Arc/MetJ-type ribon-helix-helix transcriptional regulator
VKKLFVRRKGMEKEFTDIAIPTTLYKKIEEKIKGTEFPSVASYVAKAMDDSLSKDEETKEAFNKEDEEKVKDRLKALGYID